MTCKPLGRIRRAICAAWSSSRGTNAVCRSSFVVVSSSLVLVSPAGLIKELERIATRGSGTNVDRTGAACEPLPGVTFPEPLPAATALKPTIPLRRRRSLTCCACQDTHTRGPFCLTGSRVPPPPNNRPVTFLAPPVSTSMLCRPLHPARQAAEAATLASATVDIQPPFPEHPARNQSVVELERVCSFQEPARR